MTEEQTIQEVLKTLQAFDVKKRSLLVIKTKEIFSDNWRLLSRAFTQINADEKSLLLVASADDQVACFNFGKGKLSHPDFKKKELIKMLKNVLQRLEAE